MNKSFKGSGIRFGNITFTRRYHPPMRTKKDSNPNVAGQWDWKTKEITIFLAGLKKAGWNDDNVKTHEEITRLFVHEVLHGVIDSILVKDNIVEKYIDYHWPHDNGMEYSSLSS